MKKSLVFCAVLVLATAAPNPGSYSSRQYQFQRSSSAYRNNELQHKEEEAGHYGRIEDPDKYEKPLEQSQYRQTSYHAPDADKDDSLEDMDPPYPVGVKGNKPNTYGSYNSGNRGVWSMSHYHPGSAPAHFGQGVIDSDYTTGNSYYQPGRGYSHDHGFQHSADFHRSDNNYGHQQHGHQHHGHYGHGFNHQIGSSDSQDTSSQASVLVSQNTGSTHSITETDTQNKDDQLISLDQTFDYSKFKDQGFGKDYLENTEGQRIVTTPKSIRATTENIRPVFETTDVLKPESANQQGQDNQEQIDFGQIFQQNHRDQTVTGQTFQQEQNNRDQSVVGQTFQQGRDQITIGQTFPPGRDQSTIVQTFPQGRDQPTVGQTFSQGRDQSTVGQTFQLSRDQSTTGQTFQLSRDQSTTRQTFGLGRDQSTIVQTFPQGRDQSTTGQTFQLDRDQSTVSQTPLQGGQSQTTEMLNNNDHLKKIFDQIDHIGSMDKQLRDQTILNQFGVGSAQFDQQNQNQGSGRTFHSGHREIVHHTTGYVKPIPVYYGKDFTQQHETGFDEPDCQHKEDEIAYTQHNLDLGKMEFGSHHKEEKVEEKIKEMTTQQVFPEMTIQESFQEATTQIAQKEENNMEMMNQEKQDEMSQGNSQIMTTEKQDETTTEYYSIYTQQHEKDYGKMEYDSHKYEEKTDEDLTQQTQINHHFYDQQQNNGHWNFGSQKDDQHEDLSQHQDEDLTQQHQDNFGKLEFGQNQEDLSQKPQDAFGKIEFGGQQQSKLDESDLSQKNEDATGWTQIQIDNQKYEDMSQKHDKHDEEYGHLQFGGQKQEDLSQKHEGFGLNYGSQEHVRNSGSSYGSGSNYGSYSGSSGYSTASSRSYSSYGRSSQNQYHSSSGGFSGYGNSHDVQVGDQSVDDLNQNVEEQQFATEVQDVSQQVQKLQHFDEQKETAFEPEETAIVVEEKTTQKPGFWKRIGGSITRTYETAKEKVKNNLG